MRLSDKIISTPLIFPKVVPESWNDWWNLWYKESTFLKKIMNNHNIKSAAWKGFNIYVKENINPEEVTGYNGKLIDCKDLFPSIFSNIDKLPIEVQVIKCVSSYLPIAPHSDWNQEIFSVRSLLYDNNVFDNFYYIFDNKKIYQKLPTDTNTWGYWDHKSLHGSDYYYGHSKILIMYYGPLKDNFNIDDSINYYNSHVIYEI